MACNNCYNGCSNITSDKCVRYTGVSVAELGISNGDTLCAVEQALSSYLVSALNGTGITPAIDPPILCQIVSKYLPISGVINLVDIVAALIQASCDLQTQINDIVNDVAVIEANYDIDCLEGVIASSGTHDILQAVITNLCSLNGTMEALLLALPNTYVQLSELDTLIQQYLDTLSATKMRNRMVPWVAVEYYGDLAGKFDGTGAGIVGSDWEDIYICNGANDTPDKRGRVTVGAIVGASGGALDAEVDPATSTNPNYTTWTGTLNKTGTNIVTLLYAQMPVHTHTALGSTATQQLHNHFVFSNSNAAGTGQLVTAQTFPNLSHSWGSANSFNYDIEGSNVGCTLGMSSNIAPEITVNVLNTSAGSGEAHSNIQPVMACHFIIYIP